MSADREAVAAVFRPLVCWHLKCAGVALPGAAATAAAATFGWQAAALVGAAACGGFVAGVAATAGVLGRSAAE